MTHQNKHRAATTAAAMILTFALAGGALAETIDLRLQSASDTYHAGDTVDVDILATTSTLLVGYGFDLLVDGPMTMTGYDTASGFVGVAATPDGDRLAGLSFSGGVDGIDILLGTAHLLADAPGSVQVDLDTTAGDLTEGFARFGSGFFDIVTAPLNLSIVDPLDAGDPVGGGGSGGGGGNPPPVPEPMTALLLVTGLLTVVRRR